MKKTLTLLAFLFLVIGIISTSCGPGKKLTSSRARVETLQTRVNKLQIDSANTHKQLNESNSQLREMSLSVKNLKEDKTSLQDENVLVINELKALSAESKMTIADQARRLKSFQNMIQMQKDVMNRLKNSISDALLNYKNDELYVYIKDGSVYVSMEEKLLFKSGSDVVDPKGKEALKSLAGVLNTTNDIMVMIEGHTDNVPIKTIHFKDNWDLSTARATSIVRILTDEYGFDPARITAAGKGIFHPVKENETEEGRAGNRRTEVILSPDMKELYKLMDQ